MLQKFIVCVQLFFQVLTLIYIHNFIYIYTTVWSAVFLHLVLAYWFAMDTTYLLSVI